MTETLRPCPRCKGDPRSCAYCDSDRRDRDARVVVHSHHVCLIVGDDPPLSLRRDRLLRAAQDLTRSARELAEEERAQKAWS